MNQKPNDTPPLASRAPSATEAALLEWRKQQIINSVGNGSEFHKTMLTNSATFGTLVATIVPMLIWGQSAVKIPAGDRWLLLAPLVCMLASSVVFAFGYFPRREEIHANDVTDVAQARQSLLATRRRLAWGGMAFFALALVLTAYLAWAYVRA